jgi:pimeloyl-ACP methyl ester carboxylesterase
MRRWLRFIFLTLVVCYLAVLGVLYAVQRPLLYGSEINRVKVTPAQAGVAQAQAETLTTVDGEKLSAWFVAPTDAGKPVYLYFHGKEGSLRQRVRPIQSMAAGGSGVLAIDYRGFGASSGEPTEAGLYEDGEAAYNWLRARVAASRIILVGESLGTGVAVWLAAREPAAALILKAPFTSAADVAAERYPFVPVRWFMKDQFRSDRFIGAVHMPVLIQHGERDNVVPVAYGKRLFVLANEPKQFRLYPDAGHNDLWRYGADTDAAAFVAQHRAADLPEMGSDPPQ